jgi:bla regulator protein BlaR1
MLLPNETILKAISWTLLHSLWQGLILAILAGLVILFTKKAKANLRYSILSGLFLAFMIAVGFTFNYEFQSDAMFISSEELIVIEDFNQDEILLPASEASDYFQIGIDFLNENSKTIVFIWFLIFSIKCFGIFRSLSDIYRIRNYRNQEVPEYWSQRVFELSQILKIKKKIVLLESQLVSVPSVTGFFKPIILIPIGLLSNLPQDQIEAILLHELAHIRRKDYFINLIQSFAEILFFFNPGVLWVSSIIKEERENCCDDIAVGITKSKSKFIHALVSFQEYNMKQNQLAMGFGSKKNQLLERAKRIIHDNNKSLNSVEKTFLSICIILIASFTVACSNTKAATVQVVENPSYPSDMAYGREATEEEEAIIAAQEAEEMAQIDLEAQEAQEEAEVAQIEAEVAQREAEAAQAEADIAQAEEAASQENLSADELKQIEIDGERARKEGEKARKEGEKARKEGEKARKVGELARIEGQKARVEGERARLEAMKAKIEADQQKLEVQKALIQSQIDLEILSKRNKEVSMRFDSKNDKREKTLYIVGERKPGDPETISDQIISELLKAKIIKSTQNLSFKLSTSKLIVNNKEISEAVQKKLKKYLPAGITATYYNYDLSTEN